MILFGPRASEPQVWATESTSVQIVWGSLPAGSITARSGASAHTVNHDGGPGALQLNDLPSARRCVIELSWRDGSTYLEATTSPQLPDPPLVRFATVSDLHLGAGNFGALRTMRDPSEHPVPFPFRCAEAAIREAVAWGAEFLIIKGDAVQHERAEHFGQLGDLVDRFADLPMLLLPGNHDTDAPAPTRPATIGNRKLPYVDGIAHVDLPGIRIIGADTTIRQRGWGTLRHVRDPILEAVRDADRPVFLALHQQLQTTRLPRYWPAGIAAPQSINLLDRLDEQRQPVLVSSGHTHRNRSRHHRSVAVSEVGSTKDWPGVWAGYTVHASGIQQVVRRIAARTAINWVEYSREALFGLWGKWSPGPIHQRCFTHLWPQPQQPRSEKPTSNYSSAT